jgi:peroxidase
MLSDPIYYSMASNMGKSDGYENVLYSGLITPSAKWGPTASNSLRNIAFGVDLLATDIIRSRTSGVRPYDDLRKIFNSHGSVYNDERCSKTEYEPMDTVECFEVITSDKTLASKLYKVYGKVSKVDGLVGFLSEDPLPGVFASETAARSTNYVFEKKRDGDRFYYQNELQYGSWLKEYVSGVTMKDLIER